VVANDDVEPVIYARLAGRFFVPNLQSLSQALTPVLLAEVDDGRGAPTCGGDRPGFEIIGGYGIENRRVQMGVNVHTARNDVASRSIDYLLRADIYPLGDDGDFAVHNTNVSLRLAGRCDDGTVFN